MTTQEPFLDEYDAGFIFGKLKGQKDIIKAVMHALHDEPPEVQAKVRRAIREALKNHQGGQE